ncbi:MAG: spermidine synthase [Moraxellaceae bacterium]|nr:MAG: spermidine synthase [Moraxellaceae bacterium]
MDVMQEPDSAWVKAKDVLLIAIMGILAGCGLIYQYILAHYAGRILGSLETAIYTMIGLMIVSMGAGAFFARFIRKPFNGFVWLEIGIATVGATAILSISTAIALTSIFPLWLSHTFGLPDDITPDGGFIAQLHTISRNLPYFAGCILGFLIGMEIPLIATVRQSLYKKNLEHNVGTLYGADYVGAGFGAAIWVLVMLPLNINDAALITAAVNILAGAIFLFMFWKKLTRPGLILVAHGGVAVLLIFMSYVGAPWVEKMGQLLYQDQVVYTQSTRYQQLTVTERHLKGMANPVYNFYINGRLQFSSNDEVIYHEMLVVPALAASARTDRILIVGGGDGLALKRALTYNPKQVTLIDLDAELIDLFTSPVEKSEKSEKPEEPSNTQYIRKVFSSLNNHAFTDKRVNVVIGDAFVEVEKLVASQAHFDAIIVDLPDPSHPDLNKLYSTYFYNQLSHLLSADGVLVSQSTSPYHSKEAFISIGRTIKAAGFASVEQYHANVPSFGEWGWSIATKQGAPVTERLKHLADNDPGWDIPMTWLTQEFLLGAFNFSKDYYKGNKQILINELGSHRVYQYHQASWVGREGLLNISDKI